MNTESAGKTMLSIGIGAAIITMMLGGCQIGDVVQVDVPAEVRRVVPSEPRVSYNDAITLFADYRDATVKGAERFEANIDQKAELVSIFTSLGNDLVSAGIPVLETLPGGGLLATGLVGLGAWFLKSPGTDKKIQHEKEASFNAALERAGLKKPEPDPAESTT